MGSMKPALEEPRPWADDERLQDPFQLGAMNLVIKLVQEFATLTEKLPEGRMLKTQSIPAEKKENEEFFFSSPYVSNLKY